jgi:hypothetical protein
MYSLSFAEDFFTGDSDGIGEVDIHDLYPVTRKPQSVMQALVSMEKLAPARFREMVKETLGYKLEPGQPCDETVFWDLLEKVRQTNTCDTLSSPIQVYVTDDHYVTVYEDIEKEVA